VKRGAPFARSTAAALLGWSLVVAGPAAPAWAHHSSSTARVGDRAEIRDSWLGSRRLSRPRLIARLDHHVRYFGRLMSGAREYGKADPGRVVVNLATLTGRLDLTSGASFGVRIPAGVIALYPASAERRRSAGPADFEVSLAQDLFSLPRWDRRPPLALVARVGLIVPTGRYESEAALSLTEVAGASDGSIGVVTHNTQASLGSGAWSALGAVELDWAIHDRVSAQVGAAVLAPATRTPDDLRWGRDVQLHFGATAKPVRRAVSVAAALDYRRHGHDVIPIVDDADPDGARTFAPVGGRHEVGAGFAVNVRVRARLSCSVQAHVPLWQHVGGVQLVETVAGTLACARAFAL
jgi:hypothetical protein